MKDKRKEMFVMDGTVLVITCGTVAWESADELQTARHSCFSQRCRLGARRRGPIRVEGGRQHPLRLYASRGLKRSRLPAEAIGVKSTEHHLLPDSRLDPHV